MTQDMAYFERHVARLLIVLYFCGAPVNSLLDGETRQIDSVAALQRFDFWVREPGHLALALTHLAATLAANSAREMAARELIALRGPLDRLLVANLIDVRRVALPGAPYNVLEDFDYALSYLTARSLVSDRPSFGKTRGALHQIVLETTGIAFVRRLLAECPMFDWYRAQCEVVAQYTPQLDKFDLAEMTYLAPDLTPAAASTLPLIPIIQTRYEKVFGEILNAVV